MPKYKKTDRRDRYDRIFVKNADSMHVIMPYMFTKRCDNEAVLGEVIDISKVKEYVDRKNSQGATFKYTWFQVIAAAIAKTILLRPKMNRFYSGRRLYDRRDVEVSFVVRRKMDEHSEEALAKVTIDREGGSVVDQIHDYVDKFVNKVRVNDEIEGTTEKMNILGKLPRFVLKFVFWALRTLEYWGLYPKALRADDPSYSSVFVTNLGSIKMAADYHHLYEWGTCSFFAVISEKKYRPSFNEDGSYTVNDTIKLGFTIDERIADGYYFARSLKLLRYLLQNPDLLDLDAKTPISYE